MTAHARAARQAMGAIKEVFEHHYPDFVGEILIVNTPGFVQRTWAVVSRLMPAWWGVRLGELAELEA